MKQKINNFIRATAQKMIIATGVALLAIIGWEQVDDRIETKWRELTTVEYVAATTTETVELRSEEERRIEEIKESQEAKNALDAYAKGVYAEELRQKAEDLAEEARAASLPLR